MPKCDFKCEIALKQECSPVYLLYIFRAPFPKNTSGGLLLIRCQKICESIEPVKSFFQHNQITHLEYKSNSCQVPKYIAAPGNKG